MVTNAVGAVTSDGVTLTVEATVATAQTPASQQTSATAVVSRLINLSVRARAGNGQSPLIIGFVVAGTTGQPLLIRGIGPTLNTFNVPGSLADPSLSLYAGSSVLAANDDWSSSPQAAQIASVSAQTGAFALPDPSRDAALLTTLPAGAYTASIGSADGSKGVVLVEVYDAHPNVASRLINISARGLAGDAPFIVGFVVAGTTGEKLLVRAVGPGLVPLGVNQVLPDPRLEVISGGASVGANDDWSGTPELKDAFARTGAFALTDPSSKDAALIFTAAPGAYSVVVSGANATAGTVLVEVYELP